MTAAGLIFSNIHDKNIPELTKMRTMASVPFGGRYRLIDFSLSNMVNSGIFTVGVITHFNYQSLMDHIGTGKDWDLARRSGGIKILPPFITAYDNAHGAAKPYSTRLEALMSAYNFISRATEDDIVLTDCDAVCNMDFRGVIEAHEASGADVTFVAKHAYLPLHEAKKSTILLSDEDGRLTDLLYHPTNFSGFGDVSLNIMVVKRLYLLNVLIDAAAHGYKSFQSDVIQKGLGRSNYRVFRFDGYYASVSSLSAYYTCSMELLHNEVRAGLFGIGDRPIFTKIRNSPPTRYLTGACVKNSLIADGCVIKGCVENSILFRGVKIGENTVIKNSILMQDTYVGDNVGLNCVITDKNVVIRNSRTLSGHETLPFAIDKGVMI